MTLLRDILVTGHGGMIGRVVYDALSEAGFEVIGLDLTEGDDLNERAALRNKIGACQFVVHLAAWTRCQYRRRLALPSCAGFFDGPSYHVIREARAKDPNSEWTPYWSTERYNPAQLDVLTRPSVNTNEQRADAAAPDPAHFDSQSSESRTEKGGPLRPPPRATVCYMDAVTHRELRNSSGEVLRRVAAGESLLITNSGEPVAVLGPVGRSVLDELTAKGRVRRATRPLSTLREISRIPSSSDSAQLLRDSRGTW